jgi:hypothetical protein
MRMSNDRDQDFVRAAIFDTAASLLDFLPSMGPREAIVFGDGVTLPGRIRFDDLPEHAMPRSRTASFTQNWQQDKSAPLNLVDVVERWRAADAPKLQSGVVANESVMPAGETAPVNDPAHIPPQPQHTQPQQQPQPQPHLQQPLGSPQLQRAAPGVPQAAPGQFPQN